MLMILELINDTKLQGKINLFAHSAKYANYHVLDLARWNEARLS